MTQPSLIERMAQALRRLDAGFCDISPSSNFSQRHEFRLALIQAREVVAEYEASHKAGGSEFVLVSAELVGFLQGRNAFKDRWFGDKFDGKQFWWRTYLPHIPASLGDDTDHKEPT